MPGSKNGVKNIPCRPPAGKPAGLSAGGKPRDWLNFAGISCGTGLMIKHDCRRRPKNFMELG